MTVSAEMPRYKCHKEVHALEIGAIEIHEDGSATIAPRDDGFAPFKVNNEWVSQRWSGNDDDLGYYVVYEDGYKSWSPAKAFKEGYSEVTT